MARKAKGQPPKAVVAIPSEPVRKAGGKVLEFPSEKAAATFFGMCKQSLCRLLRHGKGARPTYGYYFDYMIQNYD